MRCAPLRCVGITHKEATSLGFSPAVYGDPCTTFFMSVPFHKIFICLLLTRYYGILVPSAPPTLLRSREQNSFNAELFSEELGML